MDSIFEEQISQVVYAISNSKYAVALTGAGISTPSGIADFRSPQSGLWETVDPFEVASLSVLRKNPKIFFQWIHSIYIQSKDKKPNSAHIALNALVQKGFIRAIITQNIDGFHQQLRPDHVIPIHGTVETATCLGCAKKYTKHFVFEKLLARNDIPYCPECGNIIKPDVVLFEEMLPQDKWNAAQKEMRHADLLLVIGSSLEVSPANMLVRQIISKNGVLIINTKSSTPFDHQAMILLPSDVTIVVPEILERITCDN